MNTNTKHIPTDKQNANAVIKLWGGLGNQMFEYAFGRALALSRKTNVKFDYSWFEEVKRQNKVTIRHYELKAYNLTAPAADNAECQKLKHNKFFQKILPAFLYKKLYKKGWLPTNLQKEKNTGIFQPDSLQARLPAYFEGYFQCEKYFEKYRPQILQDFSLKIPLNDANRKILSSINQTNSVSLHIRRGDYVNNARANAAHGLCSLTYYQNAMDNIASQIQNPHFFIFSDDLDWAARNLKPEHPFTLVDINTADTGYFDMFLMSRCKHNIIANSSFSWWGAWLNQNPEKIVIAPKKWNNSGISSAILCDGWIKL
ncbi:MAG: alpha-1,2-fucosyltransferase [Alphaproteobacteria bacterium]|nr:alpha-1,2-fucosyltransferase [Alphaproteobacteria bacterium]